MALILLIKYYYAIKVGCLMKIDKQLNGDELILSLEGELNTSTYQDFEMVITDSLKGIKSLIIDFANLSYISSAGLRVLLIAQKVMDKQGKMVVRNINDDIRDIFNMTGFSTILTIE